MKFLHDLMTVLAALLLFCIGVIIYHNLTGPP